jgi:gamma-glutamylcyclotransferase (GGCT)/AIG2-like uncharacterized protein YtfP
MTANVCDFLFVYGSLISAIAHPMGERLRQEALLVGPATVQGRLYRVSWYPGVALSDDAADQVHGEVYRLINPMGTLEWLDAYESITPGPTGVAAHDEYERRVVSAYAEDGTSLRAWMYIYRPNPSGLMQIATGRWTG